jgi:glycosyltransferase involved in cell wall biosynthesis
MLTYNRKELLKRQLESILFQEYRDFELILIDNGSTDKTNELCMEYAAKDSRIHTFKLEVNKGTAFARNYGIEQVKGDYILFIDDDDYCEKEMFSHLYRMVKLYNADIAITGCVDEYTDGTIIPKYVYDETYCWTKIEGVSEFLKREKFHTAPGTKLFRTSLFKDIRFQLGNRIDDIHVIYKLFVAADIVVAQGKPYYRFYKHAGNETGFLSGDILKPEILEDYIRMQDERVEYISERIPELIGQVRYAKFSYMVSMVERIQNGLAINCDDLLSQMKDILYDNKQEFLSAIWLTEREKNLVYKYIK